MDGWKLVSRSLSHVLFSLEKNKLFPHPRTTAMTDTWFCLHVHSVASLSVFPCLQRRQSNQQVPTAHLFSRLLKRKKKTKGTPSWNYSDQSTKNLASFSDKSFLSQIQRNVSKGYIKPCCRPFNHYLQFFYLFFGTKNTYYMWP